MKVTRDAACRIQPSRRIEHRVASSIPVNDATYAYHRTLSSVYLFEKGAASQQTRETKLKESLARTLDDFPPFVGRVESYEAEISHGKLLRTQAIWGTDDDPGVEWVEARTAGRIGDLLPPHSVDDTTPYAWDRSATPLRPLAPPQKRSATCACRIQYTTFACQGWSIGIDMDHGLADAQVVGLFMNHWSSNYSALLRPNDIPVTVPPKMLWQPDFLDGPTAQLVQRRGAEAVLANASVLPTRRPDFRGESSTPVEPHEVSLFHQQNAADIVSCMLHIPTATYTQITEDIRARAGVRMSHHVAMTSVLWAALNRARTAVGTYHVGLHFSVNMRYRLGLPEGLFGCPNLVVMLGGKEASTDPVALAVEMAGTLERYDEDAMLSVLYSAMQRPSPGPGAQPRASQQRDVLEVSVAMQSRANDVSFGGSRPVFLAPIIPIPYICIIRGGTRLVDGRWHDEPVDCFFNLPQDELDALLADPAFASFENIRAF